MAVIRERTQVFNQPVGVRRVASGEQELWQTISRNAGEIADRTFSEAAKQAEQRGIDTALGVQTERLTTINPESGKPEAFAAPEGFGSIATDAYQRVVNKRYESSMLQELQLKSSEMASKYEYDPSGYDRSMSQYIAAMSENAEGRYKQLIVENGEARLASEMINIKNRVRVRARANAAASISAGVDRGADDAYAAALAGDFEGAASIAAAEGANAENGTRAGLLRQGASDAATSKINGAAARGAVEFVHTMVNTSVERNAVDLFIRTNGARGAGLSPEVKGVLTPLLGYITRDNKEQILGHSATVAVDYNQVERDQIAIASARAEAARREAFLTYDANSDAAITTANNVAAIGFAEDSTLGVNGAVGSSTLSFDSLVGSIQNQYLNNSITREQMDSAITSNRQELLRPFIVQAAADGNVVEFRAALASGNPDDMENLSANQVELINSLQESRIFVASEDTAYVQGLVASTKNEARIKRDEAQATNNFKQELTDLGNEFQNTSVTPEALAAAFQRINDQVGTTLTVTEAQAEVSRLGRSAAFGSLNLFAETASSASLNRLAGYIDTNGEKTDGMSSSEISTGNRMLNATGARDVDALVSKVNGLRSTASLAEAVLEKEQTHNENMMRVATGQGDMASTEDRRLADEVLQGKGQNLIDFASYDQETQGAIMGVLRSTFPQTGVDALESMAQGQEVNGSEAYLNLFTALSSDMTNTGVQINRLSEALPPATTEFLRDVVNIRRETKRPVSEIAMTLRARRDDPAAKAIASVTLGKVSPQDFAFNALGDIFVALELKDTVEYLSLTGKSADQITNRIKEIVNTNYPEVKFIADPRAAMGSLTKSRYSLEATFPDEEVREAFIKTVESELSELGGYSLFADRSSDVLANQEAYAQLRQVAPDAAEQAATEAQAAKTQVYLVPNPNVAGVAYYAYTVDKYGDLVPIIYKENGADAIPQFGQSDVADFRILLAASRNVAEEAQLDLIDQGKERLRNIPAFNLSVIP